MVKLISYVVVDSLIELVHDLFVCQNDAIALDAGRKESRLAVGYEPVRVRDASGAPQS